MKNIFIFLFAFTLVTKVTAQKEVSTHQLLLPGHNNDLNAVAYSLKFNILASAGWDNSINIYSGDTTFKLIKNIPNAHRATINALKFNKQGNLLASASNDFAIHVYDSVFKKTKMLVAEDGHISNINALTFDNSGKVIFSGDDAGKIIIWSLETQKKLRELNVGNQINALTMSFDPKTVFVAGKEPVVRVINVANGQTVRSFVGHTDMINAIEISPNQKYLLTGSNDKSARIWDLRTAKEIFKLPVDCWKVTAVAFSFDSKYCATGCNDGKIKIWEVETGKLIETIEPQNYNVRDLVFLKRYSQIASAPMLKGGNDYGVRIYPTDLVDPFLVETKGVKLMGNKFQNEIDSVMKIRTLTKQDSVKYQIKPLNKVNKNTSGSAPSDVNEVKIFKTPAPKK
jgi:WD40 repeat protein